MELQNGSCPVSRSGSCVQLQVQGFSYAEIMETADFDLP